MPTSRPSETTYLKGHIDILSKRKAFLIRLPDLTSFQKQEVYALEKAIALMIDERARLQKEKEELYGDKKEA